MKDLFGIDLELGDLVGLKYNSRYQYIIKGKVIGFTPKKVRVEFLPNQGLGNVDPTLRDSKDLIKSWGNP